MQVLLTIAFVCAFVGACSDGTPRSLNDFKDSGGAGANSGGSGAVSAAGTGGASTGTGGAANDGSLTPGGNDGACDFPLSECSTKPQCKLLYAHRLYTPTCSGPFVVVGCGDLGCGASPTLANDPTGNLWGFESTCIPTGWTFVALTGGPFDCPDGAMPDAAMPDAAAR